VFVLMVLPFAWGYLLATRVLRESQRWLGWALAYALGLLSFLIGVNALFYWLPIRWSVYGTVTLLGIGAALLLRVPRRRNRRTRALGRVEGSVLAVLALTAFFEALFWQMQWSDDDFFVHAPVMALFLRGVFPTQNPYFSHLPLITHYGRDLTISALSVLAGERFLLVQYVVTAANQAAAVLIAYFMARRFLRSPTQALWAVLFAFAGLNFDGRRGLLETFQNNNSFAFLFLFVNIYLFLTALARRSPVVTVLSGVTLGAYALIYETSYGLLVIAFSAFPVALCALRRRWRLHYVVATAGIVLLSAALALTQGGVLTEVAKRNITRQAVDVSRSEEDRRMSHELKIRIPKPGFTITGAFRGDEYPLWSWRLAEDAGTFAPLLPLTALLMIVRRKPWGVLLAGLAFPSILIPAVVDFGTFNSESLRFLIVGGVGGALLFGVTLGMVWDAIRMRGTPIRAVVAVVLGALAIVCFRPSARFAYEVIRDTARYPHDHYLVPEEWGCTTVLPRRPCEPIDVAAAVALRPSLPSGDRVLVDFRDDDLASLMSAQATFITFARTFLAGPGLRILPEANPSQMTPFWDGEGYRARAFLGTGEVDILDDLGVQYVYLNPANYPPNIYDRIRNNPRLERVVHLEWPGGGAVREAYRIRPAVAGRIWAAPDGWSLVGARQPLKLEVRGVFPIELLLSGPSGSSGGTLRLSYEIRLPDERLVTENDEVRLPLELRPAGGRRWTGTLWLATPYDPGKYEARLFGWDGGMRVPLRGEDGRQAVVSIVVE
jgi:hypothetical protein